MAADTHGKAKILIVDDEKLIRLTLSAKLKKVGYYTVAVDGVESAVAEFKKNPDSFSAVITDIMMGEMDGFMFRDIIRGFDPTVPIFFLTALDPEEGGGFLKKILDDPISYYLPKAVPTNVLLKRIRQVVASHRVEMFIQNKMDEDRKSLELAAHIQRSLLPIRAIQTPRGFYSTYWRPADIVSGDLIEAIRYGTGSYLYVLGDIQGHGTSAALAMTAVQSFLKNLLRSDGAPLMTPDMIANMMQSFFRANLAEVSYMTVLICIHRPLLGSVQWISCGAPDLIVVENGEDLPINPEKKGGVPIGLFPDTVYTANDVVETTLSREAICIAYTDGLFDISRDVAGEENAYAIGYKRLSPIHVWSDEGEDVFYEWRFDIDLLTEGNTDYWYVSDKDRDGQDMRFIHDVDLYEHEDDDEWTPPLEQQRYLLFLDRNCYQYEITLPYDDFGMLNFLFLEPEHTFTNIENGFGLFGAFSMLEVK